MWRRTWRQRQAQTGMPCQTIGVVPSQSVSSKMLGLEIIGPGFGFDDAGLGIEESQMGVGREDPIELIRGR